MYKLKEQVVDALQAHSTPLTHLFPVILCGGAGSRLWPLSREEHPKPFIKLADGQSLLQKAYVRATQLPGIKEVLTVTNRDMYFKIEDEYNAFSKEELHLSYILEPVARNTAPAMVMAALYLRSVHGDDAQMLLLPADHLIQDDNAFLVAISQALEWSQKGKMVTFGMTPTYPETGFGYIEADGEMVTRFVEKPSMDVAREYIERGNYYWNSGMFCFPVGVFLAEMAMHAKDMLNLCQATFTNSRVASGPGFTQIELDSCYSKVPGDSIDYALMEPLSLHQSKNLVVVPCDLGWSDIGSWNALSELVPADALQNRVLGDVYLQDTHNTFVRSDDRVVGVVGVKDLIVVDTPDALLVVHKDHAQSVKSIYNHLKAKSHEAYKIHRKAFRPWGSYTVLEEGAGFKIKRIEVKPGAALSLQMHHHRSEHWIVVSGMAKVLNGETEFLIQTNESTYIPAGHKHRLQNPGKIPLVMIEVQSGAYLGEDDIVRFEDVYGRV